MVRKRKPRERKLRVEIRLDPRVIYALEQLTLPEGTFSDTLRSVIDAEVCRMQQRRNIIELPEPPADWRGWHKD